MAGAACAGDPARLVVRPRSCRIDRDGAGDLRAGRTKPIRRPGDAAASRLAPSRRRSLRDLRHLRADRLGADRRASGGAATGFVLQSCRRSQRMPRATEHRSLRILFSAPPQAGRRSCRDRAPPAVDAFDDSELGEFTCRIVPRAAAPWPPRSSAVRNRSPRDPKDPNALPDSLSKRSGRRRLATPRRSRPTATPRSPTRTPRSMSRATISRRASAPARST